MSKTSIEIGVVKGRETGLHDARPLVSVEVSPGSVSTVVTSADQADQGLDMGTLRVANGSLPIFVSVGVEPDASVAPRRFLAAWDTFEGIIKSGHRVAVMLAGSY
ncbi:hypothetical protein [Methylobacterium sp. SD21]|uniref:hypothetical protein n=1 Tax=Methylobacterium litchii TaxID=3138810 RepID=UPI00313A77DB